MKPKGKVIVKINYGEIIETVYTELKDIPISDRERFENADLETRAQRQSETGERSRPIGKEVR